MLEAYYERTADNSSTPGYKDVLTDPRYKKATWLAMAIAFFNQMSGVNLISIYSTTLFENLQEDAADGGFSITPGTGTALVGVSQFIGCLVAPLLGKCFGLKPIFVGGQFAMAISQLAVAIAVG